MNSEKNVTGLDGLSPGERQTLAELNAMTTGEPMPAAPGASPGQVEQFIAQPQPVPQQVQPQPQPQPVPQQMQPQPQPQPVPQQVQPQPQPQPVPQQMQPQPQPQPVPQQVQPQPQPQPVPQQVQPQPQPQPVPQQVQPQPQPQPVPQQVQPQPQPQPVPQQVQPQPQPQPVPQQVQPQPQPQPVPQQVQPQPQPQPVPQQVQPQPQPQPVPQQVQPTPVPQPQPAPVPQPQMLPEDPERVTAIDTEIQTLTTQKAALAKKVEDGEMDFSAYVPQSDDITNKMSSLVTEQNELKRAEKTNAQSKKGAWDSAQQQFFSVPQNKAFLETASLRNRMDTMIKSMEDKAEYANLTDTQALQFARDTVAGDPAARTEFVGMFGDAAWHSITGLPPQTQILPPQAQPYPQPGPVQPQVQPQPQPGPVTLGDVPAAAPNVDQPGGGAANAILNSLDAPASPDTVNDWSREQAIDQMTPAQQDQLAREAARRDAEAGL